MVAPFSKFYGKSWVGFCLNTWKLLRGLILKPTERALVLLKNGTGDCQIALHFRDRHVFIWQSVEILNVFNTLTLKQIFWKTKTFFKKLGYRFLVESTKIENTSFLYKTATSEANVKTNRMMSTKLTYHKDRSFASNYFIFLNFFCLQFKNFL